MKGSGNDTARHLTTLDTVFINCTLLQSPFRSSNNSYPPRTLQRLCNSKHQPLSFWIKSTNPTEAKWHFYMFWCRCKWSKGPTRWIDCLLIRLFRFFSRRLTNSRTITPWKRHNGQCMMDNRWTRCVKGIRNFPPTTTRSLKLWDSTKHGSRRSHPNQQPHR